MKKIVFVCLGNICRSPLAQGVMEQLLQDSNRTQEVLLDSAGMLNYHEGELPDERMRLHASRRGYDLTHRSRPIQEIDFERFDLVIGMDDRNIDDLKRLAPTLEDVQKIHRMTDFCLTCDADHIPDPYYGGAEGFEHVIDLVEDACQGLLKHLASSTQGS